MNETLSIGWWKDAYGRIKKQIPTVLKLFGENWLDSETTKFIEATHQHYCHPLLSLIIGADSNDVPGCEAANIERIFTRLNIPESKIKTLKSAKNWTDFLPEFLELWLADQIHSLFLRVEVEPEGAGGKRGDLQLNWLFSKIGVEINTITPNKIVQASKAAKKQELEEAVKLSTLVKEYRQLKAKGETNFPSRLRKKMALIKEWDKRWKVPTPQVFSSMSPPAQRYGRRDDAVKDLANRKSGGKQISNFSKRLLVFFIPDNAGGFFSFPTDFHKLFESQKPEPYKTSGLVYQAFYGSKGDPLFHNHMKSMADSFVKEYQSIQGRFTNKSSYSGALILSFQKMHNDALSVPIEVSGVYYEPVNGDTLPRCIVLHLVKRLGLDYNLCEFQTR